MPCVLTLTRSCREAVECVEWWPVSVSECECVSGVCERGSAGGVTDGRGGAGALLPVTHKSIL